MDSYYWSWDKRHELLRADVNDINGRYYITAQCVNTRHQFDISSDPHITSKERLDVHIRNAEEKAVDSFLMGLPFAEKLEDRCNCRMLSEEEVKTRIEATLKKQEA